MINFICGFIFGCVCSVIFYLHLDSLSIKRKYKSDKGDLK